MATLTFLERSYCLLKCSDRNVIDRYHLSSHKNKGFGTSLYKDRKLEILDLMAKA